MTNKWHWAYENEDGELRLWHQWTPGAYPCCCTDGHHNDADTCDAVQSLNILESENARMSAELAAAKSKEPEGNR